MQIVLSIILSLYSLLPGLERYVDSINSTAIMLWGSDAKAELMSEMTRNTEHPTGNFYRVNTEGLAGYIFLGNFKGRTHTFVASVYLDMSMNLLKVKIENYPVQHGVGVTSKKWLGKFEGKNFSPGQADPRVDAVSGSTVSAQSLIEGIRAVTTALQHQVLIPDR